MQMPRRLKDLLRPVVQRGRRGAQRISRLIRPWQPWGGVHHPLLAAIEPWSGESDGTWVYDSLGVRTDPRFRPQFCPQPRGVIRTTHPEPYAPYFELVFVLEAVAATPPGRTFEMIELGAGYGAWLMTAHRAAAAHGGPPVRLTGIEMVPRHVDWMQQHFENNGADPREHRLLHGAVSDRDGELLYRDELEADFGQTVQQRGSTLPAASAAREQSVPCWTLRTLLGESPRIGLIHSDIQGEELRVFAPAIALLRSRVERLLISTHSRSIHTTLRRLLLDSGFESVYDFPVRSRVRTEYGDVQFLDGLLCFRNPELIATEP